MPWDPTQWIMKWDFGPKEIITGEVTYSLEDFMKGLWEEIKIYGPGAKTEDLLEQFGFRFSSYLAPAKSYLDRVIDKPSEQPLLFWKDVHEGIETMLGNEPNDSFTEALENLEVPGNKYVTILRAIVIKKFMDFRRQDMDLFEAREAMLEYIGQAISKTGLESAENADNNS